MTSDDFDAMKYCRVLFCLGLVCWFFVVCLCFVFTDISNIQIRSYEKQLGIMPSRFIHVTGSS